MYIHLVLFGKFRKFDCGNSLVSFHVNFDVSSNSGLKRSSKIKVTKIAS